MSELENGTTVEQPKRKPGRPKKAKPPVDRVRPWEWTINGDPPPSTKLQFDAVLLKHPIRRLGSSTGLAATDTAKFSVQAGNVIELDTTTNLVTISKGAEAVCVNREDCEVLYPFPKAK